MNVRGDICLLHSFLKHFYICVGMVGVRVCVSSSTGQDQTDQNLGLGSTPPHPKHVREKCSKRVPNHMLQTRPKTRA